MLSTHTAFPKFTFCDLTDEIEPISNTFAELGIGFDAIYTGYLGSFRQLGLVGDLIDLNRKNGTAVIIDPAMADHGKLYHGFTPEFAKAMADLCSKADLIIPNLTEASFMLGIPYTEEYDEEYIREVLKKLCALGCKRAAITGVSFENGKLGVYSYDSTEDKFFSYFNEHLPVAYHGTGDIYASATVGAMMRGHSVERALTIAVDYTLECIRMTMADEDRRTYGVNFEQALPQYIKLLEEK